MRIMSVAIQINIILIGSWIILLLYEIINIEYYNSVKCYNS